MFQRVGYTAALVWLVVGANARGAEPVDFATQIQPIFLEHCAKCHGEAKAQGKMRLDSAAGVEEKSKADPELIAAGHPDESELYQRLVLPEGPKRMPRDAPPLAKEQIDVIAAWIKAGAVLSPTAATVTETTAKPRAAERPSLPDVAAAPREAIDRLTAAGARVTPLYAGSALLEVTFAGRVKPAQDADLLLLGGVTDQVYTLNLAEGQFSDSGLAPLASLKNLSRLHLERSNVTDAGLAPLAGLAQLEYLNLYGTGITDAGLEHLRSLPRLSRLYLWQAKVSYDAAMGLEQAIPGLIVNLGYDHPVVMQRRLEKELGTAKEQAEAAKADEEKSRLQLERAKKEAEGASQRVRELEQKLKALEPPAGQS